MTETVRELQGRKQHRRRMKNAFQMLLSLGESRNQDNTVL